MGKKLVLLGAGHHAREIIWLINTINENCSPADRWEIVGLIDDVTEGVKGKIIDGLPVLGGFDFFERADPRDLYIIAAVGDPETKKILVEKAGPFELPYATLVHPSAVVAPSATVGPGSVVFPLSILSVNVAVGDHVTINMACSLSHDCQVKEFATLSPKVALAGRVTIGESIFLGTGCTVKDRISIGEKSIIGAGAVVVEDIPSGVTAMGVPAKPVSGS